MLETAEGQTSEKGKDPRTYKGANFLITMYINYLLKI